jgi:hypothetical protein
MSHFCVWDFQDDWRFPPIPCDKPASVRIRGYWYCETHADEAEALHAPVDSEAEEEKLRNLEEL